jgi:hypothetical protein
MMPPDPVGKQERENEAAKVGGASRHHVEQACHSLFDAGSRIGGPFLFPQRGGHQEENTTYAFVASHDNALFLGLLKVA